MVSSSANTNNFQTDLRGNTTLDQSGPKSNGNEMVTPHSPDHQKFSRIQLDIQNIFIPIRTKWNVIIYV